MTTKIIFFASDEFGANALQALSLDKQYKIVGIVSPVLKKQGRNRKFIENEIDNSTNIIYNFIFDIWISIEIRRIDWVY